MSSLNLFIQTIHYTINRCNRAEDRKGKLAAFGNKDYSKEELVAKLGIANLMIIIGHKH